MSLLKQLANSRWFPTLSKPLIAGAIAAGITFALHALGVTSVLSNQVNALATAAAGLLITAIVAKPAQPSPQPAPGEAAAQAFADVVKDQLPAILASNPTLLMQLIEQVLNPPKQIVAQVAAFEPAAFVAQTMRSASPGPLTQAQEAQEDGVIR